MKKKDIKLRRSLSFDKEIIAKLDESQLEALEGGKQTGQTVQTEQSSCAVFSCNPANCRGVLTDE